MNTRPTLEDLTIVSGYQSLTARSQGFDETRTGLFHVTAVSALIYLIVVVSSDANTGPIVALGAGLLAGLVLASFWAHRRLRRASNQLLELRNSALTQAAKSAEVQYGVTGVDAGSLVLASNHRTRMTVSTDSGYLDVDALFPSLGSPLVLMRNGIELPSVSPR